VCQDAIGGYETWLHGRDASESTDPVPPVAAAGLARFLTDARWLKDKGMDEKGRLPYLFTITAGPSNPRTLKAPWYSAMAQGLAMSVFLRAYDHTGDPSYLAAARAALQPCLHDVTEPPETRGVASGNGLWLEEYPDATHVLNGSIFGMLGIWDLWRVTRDGDVKAAFDRFEDNLARNVGRYESHGAILYEEYPERFSYPTYFILQNAQLDVLAVLTDDARISATLKRWTTRFRAFPAPEFSLPARVTVDRFSPLTLSGRVDYFYRYYYPWATPVAVTLRAFGSAASTIAAGRARLYPTDNVHATFSWTSPPMERSGMFDVTVAGQPVLAPFNQPSQYSHGSTELSLVRPSLSDVGVLANPTSPNGDGWNDWLYLRYRLAGHEATVVATFTNAAGAPVASVPARTVAGKAAVGKPGVYWIRFTPVASKGRPLPDGVYGYVLRASSRAGSARTSGWFFVDSTLRPGPALRTRPVLSAVTTSSTRPQTPGAPVWFRFTTSADAWVTIRVFGGHGRVRTVVYAVKCRAGRNGRLWDGRDDAGRRLPAGTYRYYVLASGGGAKAASSGFGGTLTLR